MKIIYILATTILFTLSSCASLQKDVFISANNTVDSEKILDFEIQLIQLDSLFIQNDYRLSKERIDQVSFLKQRIDTELKRPHLDKVVESRLLALKGRCAYMQEKKTEATKCYKIASKKLENDIQLLILQRRLGIIKNISTYRVKNNSEALIIEDALEHFENKEYDIAAGLFDLVFIQPNSIYKEFYFPLRQKAWENKNINTTNTSVDWNKNSLTVLQMMTIANSKENLLDYYTGGKKYEDKKLFQLLKKSNLIKSINEKTNNITEKTEVNKIIAARFIWNLYSSKKSINPYKYSTKYKNKENAKSPIDDIDLNHPDFDAVIGTVENEIMYLADGKNFEGNKLLTPAEFDTCIKKLYLLLN